MSGQPDPKPPKNEKDSEVTRLYRLQMDECENPRCRKSNVSLSIHHILYGADGRHDDARNFLALCGDGVAGCHGKAHHADDDTLRGIGEALAARPEKIAFVKERLGEERGLDYLRRRYRLVLP